MDGAEVLLLFLAPAVWGVEDAWGPGVCDGICLCSVATWQLVAVMETTLYSLTGVPTVASRPWFCSLGPLAVIPLVCGQHFAVTAVFGLWLGWMWPERGTCRLQFLGASWCCVPGRVAQSRLGRAWGTQPGRGVHVVPLQGFVSWGARRE